MHSSIIYEVAEILSTWSTHKRNDMPNKLIPAKLEFIKTVTYNLIRRRCHIVFMGKLKT
jgi:hypothetical protein